MNKVVPRTSLLLEERVPSGWTFQAAAAALFSSRHDFLSIKKGEQGPRGMWEITCFPFKSAVKKPPQVLDVEGLRIKIQSLQNCYDGKGRYYTIKELEELLRSELIHAPIPLRISQEPFDIARRAFAIDMYYKGFGFNKP